MKMHLLSCGRLKMRKSIFVPAAEKSETIELPVSSALFRHGEANVLFDTGCHPSVPDDPQARWGGLARLMTPIMQPGEHVLNGLNEAHESKKSVSRLQKSNESAVYANRGLLDVTPMAAAGTGSRIELPSVGA